MVPSRYTLEVSGFPDSVTDEEDISSVLVRTMEKELNSECPIVEVNLAREYYGTLFLHRNIAQLTFETKVEKYRLKEKGKKSSEKLERMYHKIKLNSLEVGRLVKD